MVHGPVREVVRGPGPLDWSTDRGSVFSGHPLPSAAEDNPPSGYFSNSEEMSKFLYKYLPNVKYSCNINDSKASY